MKKNLLIFSLFLVFCHLSAEEKKKICLNMIVKNETKVIERCLNSVRPLIDYWVIVDTGSDDGTQERVKHCMKDIPGELHERPWKNFGHNRNEALQLAKGKADYILFIDADEVFTYDKDFKFPSLDKDFYHIMAHFAGTSYTRVHLIKDILDWQWVGVLHEYIDSSQAHTHELLKGVIIDVYTDGMRSQDPDKYAKDAKVLEAAYLEDPNNSRNVFYLAQSYKDAGDYANSLKYYQKRIDMGGWDEEIFWSMVQIGLLEQALQLPPETFLDAFSNAYHHRPTRIEPLYYLASYYRKNKNYPLGYLMASIAVKLPMTKDMLFVQKWMYDYGALLELSICSYWIGKYDECSQICYKLLASPDLPQPVRSCVEGNLAASNLKLIQIYMNDAFRNSSNP